MWLNAVLPAITYAEKLKEPINVKAGQKMIIETNVTGHPTPTVVWTFNEQPVDLVKGIAVENKGTSYKLHSSAAITSHAGTYKLKAENKAGEATAEFIVVVKGKPTVLIFSATIKFLACQSAISFLI